MKTINIYLKLDNKDIPYKYSGEALLKKDIIEFNDNKDNYIFDKTAKRFVKSNNRTIINIDFLNKEINIKEKDNELTIKIIVKKLIIDGNNIDIIYKVDNYDIKLSIKEV
jgi:hypothetical protein